MVQGRFFRPKDKALAGTGYDSNLERRVHEGPLLGAEHHGQRYDYVWEHKYEPDFIVRHDETVTLVECKGYFQDRDDCTKYIWVRKSLPPNHKLVFCFENPHKAIHFQAKRQNGTKMTHAEWCIKNGFEWFTEQTIGAVNENPAYPGYPDSTQQS
jgi:hypothetical protein